MFTFLRGRALRHIVGAAAVAGAVSALPNPALAKGGLPDPYVSPALDAVLMPITPAVKQQFNLPKAATGVVVASVQPGGVGELYGFEPGEVISRIDNKLIRRPVDLDSIVGYGVDNGESLFVFDGLWKGRKQRTIAEISGDGFRAPVSFERADSWPGYRGRGFDYVRWYSPYAPRARDVWDETFTYIAAVIITDIFLDALRSDQAVFYYVDDRYYWPYDEYYITDVDQVFYTTYSEEVYSVTYTQEVYESYYEETYVETYSEETYYEETAAYSEEVTSEETVTEESYSDEGATEEDTSFVDQSEDVTDDTAAGMNDETAADEGVDTASYEDQPMDDAGSDMGMVEEPSCDVPPGDGASEDDLAAYEQACGLPAEEQASYDEPAAEEQTYDEPAYEEAAPEEQTYDEPAYEEAAPEEQTYDEPAYDEEPVYEVPTYEEPAYEEPAYEEPAYDGGGGEECPVDEDGNLICE